MNRLALLSAGKIGANADARVFDDRGRLRPILDRRDVALVPSLAFLIVSMATIVSVLLRPGERDADLWVILWSLVLSAGGGLIVWQIDHPVTERLRGASSTYLVLGAVMSAALGLLAWFDGGIGSVYFTTTIGVATYLGLVLPQRFAVASLLTLGAVTALLEVFKPADAIVESLAAPVLIIAGWSLGRVGHRFHGRSAYAALLRSRSDELTTTLNRRGFFEQLEYELLATGAAGRPLSLLLIDLNGFKAVNDARGHAAGDALLRWVGAQLPGALPADAAAGRLGGDEFAVILPGADEAEAARHAGALRAALEARIGASIGVATSFPQLPVGADELVRTADRRMYADKRGLGPDDAEHHVPLGRQQSGEGSVQAGSPHPPPITYAAVKRRAARERARGGRRRVRLMNPIGQFTVLVSGLVLAQAQLMNGADTVWDDRLSALMLPWAIANLALIALTLSGRVATSRRAGHILYLCTTMLLGIGLTFTMLAGSGLGIASPIAATFFLKVLYDAFATSRRQSRHNALVLLGWWVVLAALGPAEALWVAPFQLAMLAAMRGVGRVARGAFTNGTRQMMQLAHADPLTGLRNRVGFEADLRRALAQAAAGKPLALLALDLDDFKSVNDTLGHEAGDALLRDVADRLRRALPGAYSIARNGGDEFVAVLPLSDREMVAAVNAVSELVEPLVGASVGYALYGTDGRDAEALMHTADARSYEAKRLRRHQRVRGGTPPQAPAGCTEGPA